MIDLEDMLKKVKEAEKRGEIEVALPVYEAEISVLSAMRYVRASHDREKAENGYKNIRSLHQDTYLELQATRADNQRLRDELARVREVAAGMREYADSCNHESERSKANAVGYWHARIEGALSQPAEQMEICSGCMGSGESGPDQVCMACDGSGGEQPAEQPAAPGSDLPMMARETPISVGAVVESRISHTGDTSDFCEVDSIRYRIADTDEHGLPVIERTEEMPAYRYRWRHREPGSSWHYGDQYRPDQLSPKIWEWQRIEDYNAHAEPAQREGS